MNNNSREHPQLKTPLVQEALLELRYPQLPDLPYGFVPGRLYEALKSEFPKLEELPLAQLPIGALPAHLVRHRFLARNNLRMFQVGVGVLTVNHVGYTRFDDFVHDCKSVLDAALNIGLLSDISRIGLRYINKAPLDRNWNEITQISIAAPGLFKSGEQGQISRLFTKFSGVGFLSTTVAWPTTEDSNPNSLAIDLDFYDEPGQPLSFDQLLKWLYDAHNIIYEAFKSSLQPEYFSELERGLHVHSTAQ